MALNSGVALSEEEADLLTDIFDWWLGKGPRRPRKGEGAPPRPDTPGPVMYLALTPAGGIAAAAQGSTGTGIHAAIDDIPGSADCQVYRTLNVTGVPFLATAGFQVRRVHNYNPLAIPGNKLVQVFRDNFGQWYVWVSPYLIATC